MVSLCIVRNCRNANEKTKVLNCVLLRIPPVKPRCYEWVKKCGRPDLCKVSDSQLYNNVYICNDHFSDEMYSKNPRTLRFNAIPTEFGVPNVSEIMSLSPKPINFPEKWNNLQKTVKSVLTNDHLPKSVWNEFFNEVYLISMAYPEPLSDQLYDSTKWLLKNHVLELLTKLQNEDTSNLLENYYTYWQIYTKSVKYINSLYLHLNNCYNVKRKSSQNSFRVSLIDYSELIEVGDMGLDVWKHNMILQLEDSLIKLLLDEFDKQRHNISMTTSSDVIAGVLNSFIVVEEFKIIYCLDLYQKSFEQPFLEKSSEYFKCKAAKLLQEYTVSEYMVKVSQILKEEEIRSEKYLHRITYYKVRERCLQHMLCDHLDTLNEEFKVMMKKEQINDMHNIYLFLRDIKDSLNAFIVTFREHIEQCGIRVIESLKPDQVYVNFVEEVLAVHTKYKSMVVDVFDNDFNFSGALDNAFTVIVNYKGANNQPSKSPEYLAKYCDKILTKTSKSMGQTEIVHKLLQSITIFRFIDDKDLFQKFYQKDLARRLILEQSQSMDDEEEMINELKQACGYNFTNKLHKMFTDIRVSDGLNAKFHSEFLQPANKLDINFSIYVLQSGAWPLGSSTVSSLVVPKQLIPCIQNFEEFYKAKFNGRKLTWLYHHCRGELKLNYLQKVYMVTMQTFQMAIMLLFENQDSFKLSEIYELLQIDNDQFKKHINSLVDCKLLLVDGDTVSLNMNFTNKRTKFHVTAALQKDISQEIKPTVNSFDNDRKNYLQAAIIRIMKVRKILKHKELVNEILSQSKSFAPTIARIKKSIETLINKGYIERTPNFADGYSYVA